VKKPSAFIAVLPLTFSFQLKTLSVNHQVVSLPDNRHHVSYDDKTKNLELSLTPDP